MKTFFSEYVSNYQTYTFGYTQYAIYDSIEELGTIYDQGFLPYSNNLTLVDDIFYRCRSLRVSLSSWSPNSENRRVIRKAAEHNITRILWNKSDFDISHPDFVQFCLNYAHERYGSHEMPVERFEYIMSRDYAQYIMEYHAGDQIIGYVYMIRGDGFIHYWFSYFDTSRRDRLPLGAYMMTDIIARAQEQGLTHAYLGTCYKESGLYKVRNFDALQRRDGNHRSDDITTLKQLCRTDTELKTQDTRKNSTNANPHD